MTTIVPSPQSIIEVPERVTLNCTVLSPLPYVAVPTRHVVVNPVTDGGVAQPEPLYPPVHAYPQLDVP